MPHALSDGQLGEFPVLIGAIREVAADDEGDLALGEFPLGQLVGVALSGEGSDHEGGVLGDLQGPGPEHSRLLILSHEG